MAKKTPKPRAPEGRATGPRRVQKPPGKQASIPVIRGEAAGRLSMGVPNDVKIAIASAILAYSDMEGSLEFLIWDITGLTFDDGKLLTQVDASMKISVAKSLSNRHGIATPTVPANQPTIWKEMQDLAELRNRIAHGIWSMHELKTPMATSFRLKGEEDEVISEAFSIQRLERDEFIRNR